MRQSNEHRPACCTVVIPLNKSSNLEITTTAEHALSIIRGETSLPTRGTYVVDLDGKKLNEKALVKMVATES